MIDEPTWVQLAAEAPTENFETYLSMAGFKFEELLGAQGAVYRSSEGKVVILPLTRKISDYKMRIAAAIQTLSRLLEEDREKIAKAISSIGFDTLKIRTGIGSNSFSLDLDEALDTLHSGYALVDYSAVTATSNLPVKYVQGRRTKRVSNYLDTVRMGQTEPGSFVLTLLLPTSRSADLTTSSEDTLSLGQRVSDTLARGLSYTKGIVVAGDSPSTEITANFANALAEIVKVSPRVEIGVDQRVSGKFDIVEFSKDDEEPLRQIADFLAPRVESRRREISGTVVSLAETRGQKSGTFVVETMIGGETKNVKVPYTRGDRKRVIEAYDKKAELTVSLEGTLVRSAGGRYTIENLVDLRLSPRGSLA